MSPCHGEDHEFESRMFRHGLVAQGLEQAPYKGEMEVQLFPRPPGTLSSAGRATRLHRVGRQFDPVSVHQGILAQLEEQHTFNVRVEGSSPSNSTILNFVFYHKISYNNSRGKKE